MEFFSMQQRDMEPLRGWCEQFVKVAVEVEDLTPKEKISTLQHSLHNEEFKNNFTSSIKNGEN